MDFTKLISIAAQKQQHAEKQLPSTKMYSTELPAPQKRKKEEKEKSEVLKKLLKEKEAEKRRKDLERQKRKEAERKLREEEEKSKRFRIPKVSRSSDSSAPSSSDNCQSKSESKSSQKPSSGVSKNTSSGDKKCHIKPESSKSTEKVMNHSNSTKSDSSHKSLKESREKHKDTSSHKDHPHKVSDSNKKSHSSSSSKDKPSSKDKVSSKDCSREKSTSKDNSKEKSSSKDSSKEKSSSKDSSKEKSSSKDSSRDKTHKESNSKDKTQKVSSSKESSENGKSVNSVVRESEHIPEFSNREQEATRWTSKLSTEEQLRIRVEFERKKARLKESLNKQKDERIRISEGKQPVFSKVPPDEAKKKAKAEAEAERRQKKIEERRLKNEQEIERIMQADEKTDKSNQKSLKHSTEKGDKSNGKMAKHRPLNLNKNKAPPKMNFQDILKLAQAKAQDPVAAVVPKKAEPVKEHRPMTQEEKDRQERKHSKEYKDWYKYGNAKPVAGHSAPEQRRPDSFHPSKSEQTERKTDSPKRSDSTKNDRATSSGKKPGLSVAVDRKLGINKTLTNDRVKQNGHLQKSSPSVNNPAHIKNRASLEISKKRQSSDMFSEKDALNFAKKRHSLDTLKSSQVKSNHVTGAKSNNLNKSVGSRSEKQDLKSNRVPGAKSNNLNKSVGSRSDKQNSSSGDLSKKRKLEMPSGGRNPHSEHKKPKTSESRYDITNENVLVCGPSSSKSKRERSPPPKPASSNPWDRIYNQMKKDNPKPVKKKKQVIEDDSDDLDEDLDGFIDNDDDFIDDDMDMDYSKHIREIFGYDKSKYRYESDYEISNMESNFREQMKEEARSARLGLQEDLEDIRKEEEELKRKALAKKKKGKSR
ncbi:glutamic acid-rich protein-like [Ylistrum balloti]|uniref:glutamic acid-rich protein-like n=1 Tax=Ylistrum balloti TaxID=509963 RepID=UPI002905B47E|nr:glutamic acid-rich protein-like [Ylistrum balloti]